MLKYLLFGGCELSAHICHTETLMNMCMRHRLVYSGLTLDRDAGRVRLCCTWYTASLLATLCRGVGIRLHVDRRFGLPHRVMLYRRRPGLLVGLLLAVAIVAASRQYLWDVRVSGNVLLSEDEVVEALARQGLAVGSRIGRLDVDSIENRLLIDSDSISWVAVDLEGNVASVEIRERLPEPTPEPTSPANLVAQRDGRIERIEAYEGWSVVTVGQYVRGGELLVSGLADSERLGWRYIRARGAVFARTMREIHIEIPLEYEQKCYDGEVVRQKKLIFFGKSIKLYKNTGFLGSTYDTICNVDRCCLFGAQRLPLWVESTEHHHYSLEVRRYSDEQAMELAYAELERRLSELRDGGAQILKSKIEGQASAEAYVLDCTLTLIENIAETVEFQVSE